MRRFVAFLLRALLSGWACGSFVGPSAAFIVLPQSKPTFKSTSELFSSTPRTSVGLYGGLYEVQEDMLTRQGILEEEWMKDADRSVLQSSSVGTPSSSTNSKKTKGGNYSAGKGFGAGSTSSSNNAGRQPHQQDQRFQQAAQSHAATLLSEGVVRIDKVLLSEIADRMRKYVMTLRDDADPAFLADVLLRKHRCDIKLPLFNGDASSSDDSATASPVTTALQHVLLESPVRRTIETALGNENTGSVLHELSCLISSPGSQRQVVHPDTPMLPMRDHPSVLTCFIALQDITEDMGPTVFLPMTHTTLSHDQFQNDKETLLRNAPQVVAVLPKGSCAIFDSRLLHCGSANRSTAADHRAIFSFSIRHSNVTNPGNPASLRDNLKGLPMSALLETIQTEMMAMKQKNR
jgi:hypothetical protein